MKILICDCLDIADQWLNQYTKVGTYEVADKFSLAGDKSSLFEKSWDYLLVFEENSRPFFKAMLHFLNIPDEKIIYALDIGSWMGKPEAVFALINPDVGGIFYRCIFFNLARQLNYFTTCTTNSGLNYIATSNDIALMKYMSIGGKNWAEDEMNAFHELAKEFYQIDDSSGLFLDLGANIGTTGIYFMKKIAPNLKLLAFEPDAENFKLLRANLILNDMEEKSVAENFGLGIEESEQTFYKNITNPGGSGMFFEGRNFPSETIKIIALDKYFEEKNLNAEDIRYIWIDTEGFEPQVLLGAQNILRKNPAPIFMEFNPHWWQKSGFYEKMMELLIELYESYIWLKEGTENGEFILRPIEKLWEFQNSAADIGALGDIFLVKKS